MEIDNASESFIGSESTVHSPTTAMDIIQKLADRDKRKRNIIVYNLPESSGKSDSDTFAAQCPSVYNSSFSNY